MTKMQSVFVSLYRKKKNFASRHRAWFSSSARLLTYWGDMRQLPGEGGKQCILGGGDGFSVFLLVERQNLLEIRLRLSLGTQLGDNALKAVLQVNREAAQHSVGEMG